MPIEFREHTLPNGLTVVGEIDHDAHTAAAGFFVKTGARDEPSPIMGVSHFLEHMMFKGSEDLSADDINRGFDDIGARNNAWTSNEMTCFYAQTLPEHVPASIDLLARMMRPALRQADFDTEKQVILEEIAMYKDSPFWVLYEEAIARHYRDHPLRHRVLGTAETVAALGRDDMERYFQERYSADNTVLSLAGAVDFDAVVAQTGDLCGGWDRTNAARDNARPPTGEEPFTLTQAGVSRAYLIAVADAPAADDDRKYAAALLAQVLGASDNSRLHWALVEEGLAEECQAAYDGHDGVGSYFALAVCDPDKADHVWEAVERETDALINSVNDDDLARLRARTATAATLGGERPGDRMQRLGRTLLNTGRYSSLAEELERIQSVTLDDLRAVAQDFPLRPWTAGRLMPE